jgi:predicted transcriptional regulator
VEDALRRINATLKVSTELSTDLAARYIKSCALTELHALLVLLAVKKGVIEKEEVLELIAGAKLAFAKDIEESRHFSEPFDNLLGRLERLQ